MHYLRVEKIRILFNVSKLEERSASSQKIYYIINYNVSAKVTNTKNGMWCPIGSATVGSYRSKTFVFMKINILLTTLPTRYNIYFFVARLVNKCSGGDVFNNH